MSISIQKKRIVVLVSGSGSNLQAILDGCDAGDIAGVVVGVISNVPNVFALARADKHQIATDVIDHTNFANRSEFEKHLAFRIQDFAPDLILLAGFMRILSPHFVNQFSSKMLNIHPSLLPKYRGLHTHQKALQNNDTQHGCSVHFVTAELDGGPIVLQSVVSISTEDTVSSLQDKTSQTEWLIYPLAVRWFCQGALRIDQDQVLFEHGFETNLLQDVKSAGCQIIVNNYRENQNDEEIH
jgi:phosphoribosylglycinamide formyltransferase-1